MSRYTLEDLIEAQISPEDIRKAGLYARTFSSDAKWTVFEFYDAPEEIRKVCCFNGGDEDWLVITEKEPEYFPRWLEKTDSCDSPDVYVFQNAIVYVGSHA